MVCDAGGSTVDITTYDFKRNADKSNFLEPVDTSCMYLSFPISRYQPVLTEDRRHRSWGYLHRSGIQRLRKDQTRITIQQAHG